MVASQYIVDVTGHLHADTPLERDAQLQQARDAARALVALNRSISGWPLTPCRQLVVFNHEDQP